MEEVLPLASCFVHPTGSHEALLAQGAEGYSVLLASRWAG